MNNVSNDLKSEQNDLLKLLLEFDELCKTNSINYSLCFGTLIGAIRHKGFIPWDDDIDVALDRYNYKKLLKAVESSEAYELRRNSWLRAFKRKSLPGSIDVFPFDHVPNNKFFLNIKKLLIMFLQGTIDNKDLAKFSLRWRIIILFTHNIGKLLPKNFKFWLYDTVSEMGNASSSEYIACYSAAVVTLKKAFKSDLFEAFSYVMFESHSLPVIRDYDYFLTKVYGDYMTPPSIENRIPKHNKSC